LSYRFATDGFSLPYLSGFHRSALDRAWCEVTCSCTTPETFAAGIFGPRLVQCSSTELRQLSPTAGIEPATLGADVTRACATPQTFLNPHTPPPSHA